MPDSGINAILSRAPGQTGKYLALTGVKIASSDMLHLGFGKHFIRSSCIPGLIEALVQTGNPDVVADFTALPPPSELAGMEPEINQAFAAGGIDTIIAGLQNHSQAGWQARALRNINRNSFSACKMALELLNSANPETPLAAVIDMEFQAVKRLIANPNFVNI